MDASTWNQLIASLPNPHLLQTWQWGQVKARFGWQPLYRTWPEQASEGIQAGALVLQRTLPMQGFAARLKVLYAPKGPLLDWNDAALRRQALDDLAALGKKQAAIFLKIDPDVPVGKGAPGDPAAVEDPSGKAVIDDLQERGWRISPEQIQFRNTVVIDLTPSEEEMLAQMKQKTRYNIKLAARRGVRVRAGSRSDFPMLYRMYAATSLRDGFVIREESYYRTVWKTFMEAGMAQPLIAEVEGEAVAAVVPFSFAGKAWYLHGMSLPAHREKMPNYLLQWEAMRRAKNAGCAAYDLWGAPDEFSREDSMWGVYRFKEGLGGQVVRTIGAWDLPLRPALYRLYTQTIPRVLAIMRRRGVERTSQGMAN